MGESCKKQIVRAGGYQFRVVQTGRQVVGTPDQLASIYGRFCGIEWKSPNGRHPVSDAQARALRDINRSGGLGIVISDPEVMARTIDALRRGATVTADPDTFHPTINGAPA